MVVATPEAGTDEDCTDYRSSWEKNLKKLNVMEVMEMKDQRITVKAVKEST